MKPLSIFTMSFNEKNIRSKEEVFALVDQMLPRMWRMESLQYWQDARNSILVKFDSKDRVDKIIVRFSVDPPDNVFLDQVKYLATTLKTKIVITQKILFEPDELNEEVVIENDNNDIRPTDVLSFLKDQKKIKVN